MALKDTVSKWYASILFLESRRYSECIEKFLQIANPSAKIIYNVGCVHMHLEDYDRAIQYFCDSIDKDKYLFVAYFLRGVCHYRNQRFDLAYQDFSRILASMTTESINYHQLGASVSLDVGTVKQWQQVLGDARKGRSSFPPSLPVLDYVFAPPKKMVASLNKADFLGKAKVISSVKEDDILYATEKKIDKPTVAQSNATSAKPSYPPRQARPPVPQRQAPHLTNSVKENCRRRWKSMELLACGQDDEPASASRKSMPIDQLVCDAVDDDEFARYNRLSQDAVDQGNSYMAAQQTSSLFLSCPQIANRPVVPPRPKKNNKSNDSSQASAPVMAPASGDGAKSVLARAPPALLTGMLLCPGGKFTKSSNASEPNQDATGRTAKTPSPKPKRPPPPVRKS